MSALPFEAIPGAASPGCRQAALLLHGVGEADRQWLLGALSTPQRARLESLLGELRSLGLPPSPELIDRILGASLPVRVAEADIAGEASPAPAAALRLSRLGPAAVAAALHEEPDALVARVVRIASDRQRRAVVRQVGPLRSRRIEEWCRSAEPLGENRGEGLHRAILDALLRRSGDLAQNTGLRAAVAHCLAVARRPAGAARHLLPGARP